MDTNILKYMAFVKAAETGSFTCAAELLNYSQPAVSHMIRDLEQEWQVTLLERDRSGVRLTSDGLTLLPHVKRLCEGFDNLSYQVDQLTGLQSGIIRIGTFSSVATYWLPKIIKAFQKDHPNIEYELLLGDYTEIETWVANGRVDFGFSCLPVLEDLESIFLERDPFLAVLPEEHPLAAMSHVPIAELGREPFLLPEKGARADVAQIFAQRGLPLNARFTTWDDYAIMSMVESGQGVSILPSLILQRLSFHLAIRELDVTAFREIAVVFRSPRYISLAAKIFLTYLDHRNDVI